MTSITMNPHPENPNVVMVSDDNVVILLEHYQERCKQLKEVAIAMREWIDAVPPDVELPAMPGFDRDWADEIIDME